LIDEISRLIIGEKKDSAQKIKFGFSLYLLPPDKNILKILNRLGLSIKNKLKSENINCRFIVSREPALSSVIVQKEKLLDEGFDFCVYPDYEKIYLTRTIACQQFMDYQERDMSRPGRDMQAGIIPPKLAKIMINLSQAKISEFLSDPFCGSATILTEALMLGYNKLAASDLVESAIINTKNNTNWLIKKYSLNSEKIKLNIKQVDVRNLAKFFGEKSLGAIVTEPFLGSTLRSQSSIEIRLKEIKDLEKLYYQAFENFSQVLKAGGRVVMIWPIFKFKADQQIFLNDRLIESVKKIGFSQELVPTGLIHEEFSKKYLSYRGTLTYFRPGQRVEREILVFKKIML
jgi:tRNA G10  N-methylase Trm11